MEDGLRARQLQKELQLAHTQGGEQGEFTTRFNLAPRRVGKIKTNAKGNLEFTRSEFRDYIKGVADEAIMKTMLCVCGFLMDEPEFNYDDEKMARMWEGVTRYIDTISDPDSPYKARDLARTVSKFIGIMVVGK